jgi:hypothetical protein
LGAAAEPLTSARTAARLAQELGTNGRARVLVALRPTGTADAARARRRAAGVIARVSHGTLALASVPALHASEVHASLAITGHGVAAAILDTGVDLDDPELAVVAQQCFTSGACAPNGLSIGANAHAPQRVATSERAADRSTTSPT